MGFLIVHPHAYAGTHSLHSKCIVIHNMKEE